MQKKKVVKPQISPSQKYFQKKQKLEAKVNNNTRKSELNICYICLVYFPKLPEIIKSHLQGKRHQKNWRVYQAKKLSTK